MDFKAVPEKGELMKPILQMCKLGHREAKSPGALKWQDEGCLLIAPSERWGFAFPACLFYSQLLLLIKTVPERLFPESPQVHMPAEQLHGGSCGVSQIIKRCE